MNSSKIFIVYAVILVALTILRLFAHTFVGRIAFSWMGPIPRESEPWSKYQLRWAVYSMDWLAQVVVLFVIVNAVLVFFPASHQYQLLWAFQFALALGGGMALLASVAFLVKSAKARLLGPDPPYQPHPEEQH